MTNDQPVEARDGRPVVSRPVLAAAVLAAMFTLASLTRYFHSNAVNVENRVGDVRERELVYLAPPGMLKAMSMGYPHLLADLIWVKALVYFGTHFTGDRKYTWLQSYVDTILALDPDYRNVYRWAGTVIMYGGSITREKVMASIEILEKAHARFPEDWEFSFTLGCNYYFELRSDDEEQVRRWRRTGAGYIERAANLAGAPHWLTVMVSSLYKKLGQTDLAVAHLEEAYLRTADKNLRREIGMRLARLKSEQLLKDLEQERERFMEDWKQSYPYVPQDLFVLIGKRDWRVRDWRLELMDTGGFEDFSQAQEDMEAEEGDRIVNTEQGMRNGE